MGALSKTLRDSEGNGLLFWCPGCDMAHRIQHGAGSGPRWTWNGSVEQPTFQPSVLVRWDHMSEAGRKRSSEFRDKHGRYPDDVEEPYDVHDVCHTFVTDGRIQFLGDCTHALAGQTVDLPEWPDRAES